MTTFPLHLPGTSDFSYDLVGQFHAMLEEGAFTDFTLKTASGKLQCHRLVVAASSPVLRAMLSHSSLKEPGFGGGADLEKISHTVMSSLLKYMYTGQISIDSKPLLYQTILACDYLGLNKLLTRLTRLVPDLLDADMVISWSVLARNLKLRRLASKTAAYLRKHLRKVCKQEEFLELDCGNVVNLLSNPLLHEDDCLVAVFQWLSHDKDVRTYLTHELVSCVELEHCSLKCLHKVLAQYDDLITCEDTLKKFTAAMAKIASIPEGMPRVLDMCSDSDSSDDEAAERVRTVRKIYPQTAEKLGISNCLMLVGGRKMTDWRFNNKLIWISHGFLKFEEIDVKLPFNLETRHSSICATPNGFMMTGGLDSDLCMEFISPIVKWTRLNSMLKKRNVHASVYHNGCVYVIGSWTESMGWSKDMEYYDYGKMEWIQGPHTHTTFENPHAASLESGVYVFHSDNKLSLLDTEQRAWTARCDLPVPAPRARLVAVDNTLFVAGGEFICVCYSSKKDSWEMREGPHLLYEDAALVYLKEQRCILLCGGAVLRNCGVEINSYDLGTKKWTLQKLKMPVALWHHAVLALNMPRIKKPPQPDGLLSPEKPQYQPCK